MAGFFFCAPEKNSRVPKLKKRKTQEKNSNSRKNIYFPAFFRQKERKTDKNLYFFTSNVLEFKYVFRNKNCQFPQKNLSF